MGGLKSSTTMRVVGDAVDGFWWAFIEISCASRGIAEAKNRSAGHRTTNTRRLPTDNAAPGFSGS
jgi:hypothetical protein